MAEASGCCPASAKADYMIEVIVPGKYAAQVTLKGHTESEQFCSDTRSRAR